LLKVKVSQQFTFLSVGLWFHHYPSISRIVVKVSQQFLFWCCRLCGSIIIPSTSWIVESKVSQQFTFLVLQVVVPSLSQVQVELLKVKVSQQFTLLLIRFSCSIIIPSTGRIVESKSIPTVHFLLAQ
jgi:hypothetical protein